MFQHILPAGNDPGALGILVMVIAPAVLLLGWLYNAYRMGRFRKKSWQMGACPGNLGLPSLFAYSFWEFWRSW